jgi:hypothetical protein
VLIMRYCSVDLAVKSQGVREGPWTYEPIVTQFVTHTWGDLVRPTLRSQVESCAAESSTNSPSPDRRRAAVILV